jgi:catechol 2,3-dioxygenase-like lactoylglutathione lyase family enzyme
VKFRDLEGHPLELICFPNGTSSRRPGDRTQGIDHSAISVADIRAAQAFFADRGLSVGTSTLNRGPAQDTLDGLAAVEVEVVPMLAAVECPHLELLGYHHPRRRARLRLDANDIAATRIVWRSGCDELVRDRDGHLHLLRRT